MGKVKDYYFDELPEEDIPVYEEDVYASYINDMLELRDEMAYLINNQLGYENETYQ